MRRYLHLSNNPNPPCSCSNKVTWQAPWWLVRKLWNGRAQARSIRNFFIQSVSKATTPGESHANFAVGIGWLWSIVRRDRAVAIACDCGRGFYQNHRTDCRQFHLRFITLEIPVNFSASCCCNPRVNIRREMSARRQQRTSSSPQTLGVGSRNNRYNDKNMECSRWRFAPAIHSARSENRLAVVMCSPSRLTGSVASATWSSLSCTTSIASLFSSDTVVISTSGTNWTESAADKPVAGVWQESIFSVISSSAVACKQHSRYQLTALGKLHAWQCGT